MWSSMLTRIMSSICMACLLLLREDREAVPAAHGRGVGLLGVVPVDVPLGEALQHFLQGDAPLQAGEGVAQAEVDAVAEGQVTLVLVVDVERLAAVEDALVAVGGAVDQH